MPSIKTFLWSTSLVLLTSQTAFASKSIMFLNSINPIKIPNTQITALVKSQFDLGQYRQVKIRTIANTHAKTSYILVYLFSKKFHRVDIARINVDASGQIINVIKNYKLTPDDLKQQSGLNEQKCPDTSIEFIAFAPNDDDFEQQITIDVANAAEAHGLKTIRLLKETATTQNYLDYMSCPKLKGNFYDGDANPEVITTYDGELDYGTINKVLANQFQYKVTNIWLACEAFNNPMLSTMIDIAQSQKYAAGINNLEVGPSDEAAACTMKQAFDHLPMTSAFQACYKKYDTPEDQWGFDGKGADVFSG